MPNALLLLKWAVWRLNISYEWWGAGFHETEYKDTNTFCILGYSSVMDQCMGRTNS